MPDDALPEALTLRDVGHGSALVLVAIAELVEGQRRILERLERIEANVSDRNNGADLAAVTNSGDEQVTKSSSVHSEPDPDGDVLLLQRVPLRAATREVRIVALHDVFEALAAGTAPPATAARWMGEAGLAWLAKGGDLERDHLRVTARRGSHDTPGAILRAHRDERQHRGLRRTLSSRDMLTDNGGNDEA